MKKKYNAPNIEIVESNTMGQLLTTSVPVDGSTTISSGEILSRRHQIDWDDEDEESY